MRLLLWNVHCELPDAARVADCLDETMPDLAVLLEATDGHLAALEQAHRIVACDYLQSGVLCRIALLSNRPFRDPSVIRHFEGDKKPPASPLAQAMGWVEFLDTVSADVEQPGFAGRVIAAHLTAGCGPGRRRRELEALAAHIPHGGACVVAGDFNSFAEPWMAPFLHWLAAYEPGDARVRERRSLETWFASRGFRPAVHGVTLPKLGLAVDHVFVRGAEIVRAEILTRRWGSDHRPLLVELCEG